MSFTGRDSASVTLYLIYSLMMFSQSFENYNPLNMYYICSLIWHDVGLLSSCRSVRPVRCCILYIDYRPLFIRESQTWNSARLPEMT